MQSALQAHEQSVENTLAGQKEVGSITQRRWHYQAKKLVLQSKEEGTIKQRKRVVVGSITQRPLYIRSSIKCFLTLH